MAPTPIPAPLPPWARFLLQVAPFITAGLQAVLEHLGEMHHAASPTPDEWRRVQAVGAPTGSTDPRARFVTTFDFVNITNGAIDNSWTQADHDAVNAQLQPLLGAWASRMTTGIQFNELRFYRMQFNPLTDPNTFVKSGSPTFVYPAVHVGSAANPPMAPQVSLTSTDRTPYPKHWGRNYWPWPSSTQIGANALATSSAVNGLAAAVESCYAALASSEFFPVVPVSQVDKVVTRGLLGVTNVQVDDVFDVIRRRRAPVASLKVDLPPLPA